MNLGPINMLNMSDVAWNPRNYSNASVAGYLSNVPLKMTAE